MKENIKSGKSIKENKNSVVTMRLTESDRKRFSNIAKQKNMSMSSLLVYLMDHSCLSGQKELIIKKKNLMCEDIFKNEQNLETKKLSFSGKELLIDPMFHYVPAIEYGKYLREDFKISDAFNLNEYTLIRSLSLYSCDDKNYSKLGKFIVYETLQLARKNSNKNLDFLFDFDVRRCAFLNTYDEIEEKFFKYSDHHILSSFEEATATEISSEENIEAELEKFF